MSDSAKAASDKPKSLAEIIQGESTERALSDKLKHEGKYIILPATPEKMTIKKAVETLTAIEAELETKVVINEVVEAFPLEGAYAFGQAMARMFGWATPLPGGFFKEPPQTLTLYIGPDRPVQVIWGRFSVPGVEGELATGVDQINGRWVFKIGGAVKKRYLPIVKELADITRGIIKNESIYRGKAINLPVGDDGKINWGAPPTFLQTGSVGVQDAIFSETVQRQINTNLFTMIQKTAMCREQRVPLKRAVLLAGKYGTGKTLVSFITAALCVQHGWTYVVIKDARHLAVAIEFARLYQPCVVFCEDIDRETAGHRTHQLDSILNTIDGIGAKNTEVMCVLTSNHVEKINRAMLRPGRLDAVIMMEPPDATAAAALVRKYGGEMILPTTDLSRVGANLAGSIPAVIREVVERSKLFSIANSVNGQFLAITETDLLDATREMKNHMALLEGTNEPKPASARFVDAARDLMGDITGGAEGMAMLRRVLDAAEGAHNHAAAAQVAAEGAHNAVSVTANAVEQMDDKIDKVHKVTGRTDSRLAKVIPA